MLGRLWLLALLLSAPLLWPDSVLAQHTDEVKAAFILNIARFVEWPDEQLGGKKQSMQLCLYRRNSLGAAVGTIRGKQVAGRKLVIRTIDSAVEGRGCHILFIPPGELHRFGRERSGFAGRPLLTVTDLTTGWRGRSAHPDILIALVRDGAHMDFEINLGAVRRSGLQVSSELLKLGRVADGN